MKLRVAITVALFASLLILANANVAQAQWSAITSGYAVTTNYHGEDVPLGVEVTAWAGTTDSEVQTVTFKWLDPSDYPEEEIEVSVDGPYENPDHPASVPQEIVDWATDPNNEGINVWYASDTHEPSDIGWWTVKAEFTGPTGPKGQDQTKFRATSLFQIDEVPFGTIAAVLIPFGFLSIYAIKRRFRVSIKTA